MITSLLLVIGKLFLPLLFLVAVLDLLTMSQPRRIRFLHSIGRSQAAIARELQISRYRVRLALAAA